MMLYDFFTYWKTQAGSLGLVGQCIANYLFELFEYSPVISRCNSDTGISNAGDDLIFLMSDGACYSSRRRKFYRIRDQVDHNLDQLIMITGHQWKIVLYRRF